MVCKQTTDLSYLFPASTALEYVYQSRQRWCGRGERIIVRGLPRRSGKTVRYSPKVIIAASMNHNRE